MGKGEFRTGTSIYRYQRHPEEGFRWYVYRVFKHDDGSTSSHRLGLIEEFTAGRVAIVGAGEFGDFISRRDASEHLYLRMPEDHPARKEHGRPYNPRIRKIWR